MRIRSHIWEIPLWKKKTASFPLRKVIRIQFRYTRIDGFIGGVTVCWSMDSRDERALEWEQMAEEEGEG